MSKKMTGSLILLFLAVSVFTETVTLFALWNDYFKLAFAQWVVWTAAMMWLCGIIGPAWQRFAAD